MTGKDQRGETGSSNVNESFKRQDLRSLQAALSRLWGVLWVLKACCLMVQYNPCGCESHYKLHTRLQKPRTAAPQRTGIPQ